MSITKKVTKTPYKLRNKRDNISGFAYSLGGNTITNSTGSLLPSLFELRTDEYGNNYIFANLDIVSEKDIIAFAQPEVTIPSIWDSLPYATGTTAGAVKIGEGLFIDSNGVLSATGSGTGGQGTIQLLAFNTSTKQLSISDGNTVDLSSLIPSLSGYALESWVTTNFKGISYIPSWNEITGKPSTFTPSTHTHIISDITSLQSSLDAKQEIITGAVSTVTGSNLTANRAVISNASGKIAASGISSTELGYLSGTTSNIQSQLDGKALSSHSHTFDSLTSKPTTLSGYGITDAVTIGTNQTITGTKTFNNTITGSITGNAGTVTNGLYSTGSYSNPSWLTSLDGVKITGTVSSATNASNLGISNNTTTAATYYPVWVTGTSGNQAAYVSSTKLNFNPSSGILTATGFSGNGSSLTNLSANNLSGTIPSAVLGNSSIFIGTTGINLNRGSGALSLSDVSLATLTRGTGLSGSNYNGSAAQTWSVAYGATSGTACEGNDIRLHSHDNKAFIDVINQGLSKASNPTFEELYLTDLKLNQDATVNISNIWSNNLKTGTSQNLLRYTEQFNQSGSSDWVRTNIGSVTANTTIAPNGAQTADTVLGSTISGELAQINYNTTTGDWVFSFYAKVSTGFEEINISLDSSSTTGTNKLITITDKWQRFFVHQNLGTSHTWKRARIKLANKTIILWGAQLEQGTIPSLYSGEQTTTVLTNRTSLNSITDTLNIHLNNNQSINIRKDDGSRLEISPADSAGAYNEASVAGDIVMRKLGNSGRKLIITNGYAKNAVSAAYISMIAHSTNDGSGVFAHNNGTVSIGSNAAPASSETLKVTGNILATGEVTAHSDYRLKHDIKQTDDVLEKLNKINIVDYKLDSDKEGKQRTGVIAQDLLPLFPQFVSGNQEDYYSVNYSQMVSICIKAIQELTEKVKDLQESNMALVERIKTLETTKE